MAYEFMTFIDVCLLIYDDKFYFIMICPFISETVSISCRPVHRYFQPTLNQGWMSMMLRNVAKINCIPMIHNEIGQSRDLFWQMTNNWWTKLGSNFMAVMAYLSWILFLSWGVYKYMGMRDLPNMYVQSQRATLPEQ